MRSAVLTVAALLPAAWLLAACEGSGGPVGPTIELVDPVLGERAGGEILEGTLRVEIAQGGSVIDCGEACTTPIVGGNYELTVDIPSLVEITEIHAWMDSDGTIDTIGAVPGFAPFGEGLDTGELPIRLVMLAPGECVALGLPGVRSSGARLTAPARDVGAVVRRNVVLLVGGVEAGGPGSRVGRFDQVVVESFEGLDAFEGPIGATRALALTDDTSIVVGERSAWRFELNPNAPAGGALIPRVPLDVHAGASAASALVDLGGGAAVVAGASSDQATWLSDGGLRTGRTDLVAPRTSAAAAAVSDGVLVVGGADEGAPVAEWLPIGANGEALTIDGLPRGHGGWLVPSPSGDAALWIGWTLPDGTPSPDAYVISGCPDACAAEAVPWDAPRIETSGAPTAAGDFWVVGGVAADGMISDAVDIVRWAGDAPAIEPRPPLVEPRAGAAVFEHAAGIVTVAGGEGPLGLREDFELCAPDVLDDF